LDHYVLEKLFPKHVEIPVLGCLVILCIDG
jgi:hypothetical protein